MNREILFRGKDRYNSWVFGLLWKKKHNDGDRIYISHFPDSDDFEDVVWVIPETVGQFTGLLDKNGKKIFEGDIVESYAVYGLVVFEDGMFTLDKSANVNFGGHKQPLCYFDAIEVTGNIHDNKEIWEVK